MHNCKATKELITELLLDGAQDQPDVVLVCQDCRNEFDSLKERLRITTRQIETAAPSESYWNGYHERLKQRLEAESRTTQARTPALPVSAVPLWRRAFAKSVRIPLPVAALLLLVFGLSLLFFARTSKTQTPVPSVSVVHVPVEVPVIQEKLVTRIVYRQSKRKAVSPNSYQDDDASTLAKSQKVSPVSLIGFKPLDEVKLTVIKGGSPDEK